MIFRLLTCYEDLHRAGAVNKKWRAIILQHNPLSHLYNTPEARIYSKCVNKEIFEIPESSKNILLSAKPNLLSNSLSPNGKRILSLRQDGIARIVDVDQMMKNAKSTTWKPLTLDMKEPSCIGFSADGKHVIACNQTGFVEIRNLLNDTKQFELQLNLLDDEKINHITYHAGQQLIAIVFNEKYINTYTMDGQLNSEVRSRYGYSFCVRTETLIGNNNNPAIQAIQFFLDGNHLIITTAASVEVWNKSYNQQSFYSAVSGETITACCVSRDGKYVAAGDRYDRIRIWAWQDEKLLYESLPSKDERLVFGIAFDDNNHIMAALGNEIMKYKFPPQCEAKEAQDDNEEEPLISNLSSV